MPKSLEPNKEHPIVLDSDKALPAESRPTFYVRSLSMRQQLALAEQLDDALKPEKAKDLFDRNCELLSSHITRWENMGGFVYGQCELQDVLGFEEARELLRKVQTNSHVSVDEKKS